MINSIRFNSFKIMTMKKYKLFTLIELMAVFVILAILAGITIGVYGLIGDSNTNTKTETTVKQLSIAMQAYKLETGYYFQEPSDAFKNPLNTTITYDNMKDNVLKFNTSSPSSIDTEFIKHFSYETFKGNGIIENPGTSSSYFVDAWGRPIIYRNPGEFNTTMFDICSLGKDGRYGDDSSDADDFGKGDDITNFNK
ncbi:MAG TPA: type II secretion system protein GspG [Victivallales bacterium]|nr:type II secretion system protein GspG [Victivallales bacterium]